MNDAKYIGLNSLTGFFGGKREPSEALAPLIAQRKFGGITGRSPRIRRVSEFEILSAGVFSVSSNQ